MRTKTETLIKALRAFSNDIQSADGVANACIAEAADRMEDLKRALEAIKIWARSDDGKI